MSKKTKVALDVEELDVVADRGYFDSEQILECDRADITVTLPKPQTSTAKARGRYGKQDFRFSNRALLSSSMCFRRLLSALRGSRFSTWSALRFVQAATSIGRIGLESLALWRARCGAAEFCGFIQTLVHAGGRFSPGTGGSVSSDHDATSGA